MKGRALMAAALAGLMALTGCGFSSERKAVNPKKIKYADSYSYEKILPEGLENADVSIFLEAEDAELSAGAAVKTSKSGYSGAGYVDISDNAGFKAAIDLPASQFYKITVRHCAGSHKENPLMFNGVKVLDIYSEEGDWQETEVNGVFLEKGENEITLGHGWSWFSLDSIKIETGESISDSIYSGVSDTLCNPYANLKTQNIYQFLKAIYGKRMLAGQSTGYGRTVESDAIYLGVGKYPALRNFDFLWDSYSHCGGKPEGKNIDLAIDWSRDGGLCAFSWHWYAPYKESAFYSADTSFDLKNAVTEVDLAHMSLEDIEALEDEGKISREAYKIVQDIDNISSLMQRLEDNNVTVLWRPLHEASGGWFWWGSAGVEPYKWIWNLLYDRMTDYHELDNLIWVWNGQNRDWYPGDGCCDIVALDIYNDPYDYGVSPGKFTDLSEWADNGKLVAMSECGTMPDPDLIVRDNAYWLYFSVWNSDYIVVDLTTELSEKYTTVEEMKKVYNSEVILTLDELPKF